MGDADAGVGIGIGLGGMDSFYGKSKRKLKVSISCFLGDIPFIEDTKHFDSSLRFNTKFPFHVFLKILISYPRFSTFC